MHRILLFFDGYWLRLGRKANSYLCVVCLCSDRRRRKQRNKKSRQDTKVYKNTSRPGLRDQNNKQIIKIGTAAIRHHPNSKIYVFGCTVKWPDDGNRLREWIYILFSICFFLASFETAMIYIYYIEIDLPPICKLKAIRTPNANIIISNCRKSNRLMKETEKTLWAHAHARALTPASTGTLCGNTSYIHSNTRTGHDCWFFFLFLLSKLYIIEAPSSVRRASVLVPLRNENIIVEWVFFSFSIRRLLVWLSSLYKILHRGERAVVFSTIACQFMLCACSIRIRFLLLIFSKFDSWSWFF